MTNLEKLERRREEWWAGNGKWFQEQLREWLAEHLREYLGDSHGQCFGEQLGECLGEPFGECVGEGLREYLGEGLNECLRERICECFCERFFQCNVAPIFKFQEKVGVVISIFTAVTIAFSSKIYSLRQYNFHDPVVSFSVECLMPFQIFPKRDLYSGYELLKSTPSPL